MRRDPPERQTPQGGGCVSTYLTPAADVIPRGLTPKSARPCLPPSPRHSSTDTDARDLQSQGQLALNGLQVYNTIIQ